MQPRYQIHIYHNGTQFVATVPELDGCNGTGQSYREALASAEKAIASWMFGAINAGKQIPEPAKYFVLRPLGRPIGTGTAAPIMYRLHQRFGNLNNRRLVEKIGLEGVTPTAFAAAAAGQGARWVRCAIALVLEDMPSNLWPHLSPTTRERDDSCMTTEQEEGGLR